jgi:hypothetical protein
MRILRRVGTPSLALALAALLGLGAAAGCAASSSDGSTASSDGGAFNPTVDGSSSTGDAAVIPGNPVHFGDDAAADAASNPEAGAFDAGPPIDASWTGRPPAAPLFVRNPYFNIWSAGNSVSGTWPTLWAGETKGMTGIARIDGVAHLLVGALSPSGLTQLNTPMTLISSSMTPTKTQYVLGAGGVAITLDFLSPVEIDDLQKQSAPIGYLTLSAESSDGQSHAVSVYIDISGEWANGDSTQEVQWARESVPHTGGTLTVQSITSSSPLVLSENSDYVQWGTAFVAADAPNMTTAIGSDVSLRTMAATRGTLDGSIDSTMPRAINTNWPVLGFAFDLGSIGAMSSSPVTLEVGLVREPAVSYQATSVPPLWESYWTTWQSMAADSYDDAAGASVRGQALDGRIVGDARAAEGDHYAALCTLALRQAFGGTELVGTAAQPWMFLKEISSDGNISTVDVVYPASPVFLYTNPYLLKLLLDPLLAYAESGLWPQVFSEHDIGASYPNAAGHNDGGGENMPVEESANMLLMMAAYAQRATPANGQAYAKAHYRVATQWASFLATNGLDPTGANNPTTDDFCTQEDHNANLGLKAVLGVGAMGVLANIAGNTADAASYSSQAKSLMTQWVTKATDSTGTHTLFAYDQPGTWGLKYNAFYDKELKMNLVPASVLALDATYYATQAVGYGVPLDSRFVDNTAGCTQGASKSDWQVWMASAIDDPSLTTAFIDGVYDFATTSNARVPFSDYYNAQSGQQIAFQARPVQGGMFSFLALAGTSIIAQ